MTWKHYPITPIAKPRMTQRDRWKKRPCVVKYHHFKDCCRGYGVRLFESMEVEFHMPMPKSWSKKKRAEMVGKPHRQIPDLDNCQKALNDILDNDSHIWRIHATKMWAEVGAIRIREII